jgi:hypothetical protein
MEDVNPTQLIKELIGLKRKSLLKDTDTLAFEKY